MKTIGTKSVGHLTIALSECGDRTFITATHRNGTVHHFELSDFDALCRGLAHLDRAAYQYGFNNGKTNAIKANEARRER